MLFKENTKSFLPVKILNVNVCAIIQSYSAILRISNGEHFWNLIHFYFQLTTNIIKPERESKDDLKNSMNREIFAQADFRAHMGHQQSQEVQVLSTRAHWRPWFNKATLFPLKWLLRERLSNRDRIPANIKGLLGS